MDADEVAAAIEAGQLDGGLDTIVLAVVDRASTDAVSFFWRITLEGDEWTQETVTLGELKFAEQHCHAMGVDPNGRPFRRRALPSEIDPRTSAEHLAALLVAHFVKVGGYPLADAVKKAETYPASALAGAVGEYEVVHPPKGDPVLTGSTTS